MPNAGRFANYLTLPPMSKAEIVNHVNLLTHYGWFAGADHCHTLQPLYCALQISGFTLADLEVNLYIWIRGTPTIERRETAMSDAMIAMHRAFLQEIRQKKAAIEVELRSLETVERYHESQLSALGYTQPRVPSVSVAQNENATSEPASSDRPPVHAIYLSGVSKHSAAKYALENIGKPSRISTIVDWLLRQGYGRELDRRVFFNSIYTAMARRTDMFEKVGEGVWGVKNRRNREGSETDRDQNKEGG